MSVVTDMHRTRQSYAVDILSNLAQAVRFQELVLWCREFQQTANYGTTFLSTQLNASLKSHHQMPASWNQWTNLLSYQHQRQKGTKRKLYKFPSSGVAQPSAGAAETRSFIEWAEDEITISRTSNRLVSWWSHTSGPAQLYKPLDWALTLAKLQNTNFP